MQHVSPASLGNNITALGASMSDKLFFASRIPDDVTVFVDFGCADGALLRETLKERFGRPGSSRNLFLGFDHDPEMLRAAEVATSFDPSFLFFGGLPGSFERLKVVLDTLHKEGRKSCLILSSVVHEVLSQGESFEHFWRHVVAALGCDYVAFRDMAVEAKSSTRCSPKCWFDVVNAMDVEDFARIVSFESAFGSLTSRDNFLHFLMKAVHPAEDWAKEMEENYLPMSAESYLNCMTIGSGYKLRHFDHSTLPALQAEWRERFGIHVPDPTHIKIILQKGW